MDLPEEFVLCTSARVPMDPAPSAQAARAQRIELVPHAQMERETLLAALLHAGCVREAVVDRDGTFAVRGNMVDFLCTGDARATRVEFADEHIESLRSFDPATQLSLGALPRAVLLGAEVVAGQGSLAEFLPPSTFVLEVDHQRCLEVRALHRARLDPAESSLAEQRQKLLEAMPLVRTTSGSVEGEGFDLGGRPIVAEGVSFESAQKTLQRSAAGKKLVELVFPASGEAQRFMSLIPSTDAVSSVLSTRVGRLLGGFHAPALGFAALGHSELFATSVRRRRIPISSTAPPPTRAIEAFLDLNEGDIVVHAVHGIARFLTLERVAREGAVQEHLRLEFADGVQLLVPAVRIDLVQKYVGGRGETPELSKFGGEAFQRRKEKVAASVLEMAADLLEVQALRAARRGRAHAPDSPWQQEFEAAFPYELTRDQRQSLDIIKKDLESVRPMDRLLCGDVGYGKTELAMRATFKCAMGGRQTVILVPTTLLAQQHAETFRERMAPWPVRVEALSRFRTEKESNEILAAAEAGAVDVLIGTHRLLGGRLRLKDLGLLVIDEEQRFGVAHKEKLRRLRADVDVLTMSATPIPRTLHQAMLGIRDISSLQEPPVGRREVVTEVTRWSDRLVREAILRELDRQGQVFFIHNRVRSIDRVAERVQALVPEARVITGHGQMAAGELEATMLRFLTGKADVLVATTIIESGIDIPSANTLFVDEAGDFGLAELHQLRGRVGRSHLQAFAYFFEPESGIMGTDATRRLAAIEEFSHLGAGFRIAMRDLEIRGAGNLLGAEQSGHIASVGYEMYCRLLDAATKRMRAGRTTAAEVAVVEDDGVDVDLGFTADIPEEWIRERKLRVEVWRRMAAAATATELGRLRVELADRFGALPQAVEESFHLAEVRVLAQRIGARRIWLIPGEGVALGGDPVRLRKALRLPEHRLRAVQGRTLLLVHEAAFPKASHVLAFLRSAVQEVASGGARG
jgi:transcription-repair coupling factor (superfamily II helicase)